MARAKPALDTTMSGFSLALDSAVCTLTPKPPKTLKRSAPKPPVDSEDDEDAPVPVRIPKKKSSRVRTSAAVVVVAPKRSLRRQESGMTDSSGASTVGSMGLTGLLRQSSKVSL
jgi:hypothetical protein